MEKLKFLFEILEPTDFGFKTKQLMQGIKQVIDFEYPFCFVDPLTENGFGADEAHLAYIVDQDLRMEGIMQPLLSDIIVIDNSEE